MIQNSKKGTRFLYLLFVGIWISFCFWLLPKVSAETFFGKAGNNVAWTFDDQTGDLQIYGDRAVTSPEWRAYMGSIRRVVVNKGVTALPDYAFYCCVNLESVALPGTVTAIGDYAFAGCVKLNEVYYDGTSSAWRALMAQMAGTQDNTALCRIEPIYRTVTYPLTIRYLTEAGEPLAPDFCERMTSGDTLTVTSPVIVGYVPEQATVSIEKMESEQMITVTYRREVCKVKVHFLDTDGGTVLPDEIITVLYGDAVSLFAPDVEGYEIIKGSFEVASLTAATDAVFYYMPHVYTVTVYCVDTSGRELVNPLQLQSLKYGSDCSMTLPEIVGYRAPFLSIEESHITGNKTYRIVYADAITQVTVRFEDDHGKRIHADEFFTVREGDDFTITSKAIAGYEPTASEVNVTQAFGETMTFTLLYMRVWYPLTLICETANGEILREEKKMFCSGDIYEVDLPVMEGWKPMSPENVLTGRMPAKEVDYHVVYAEISPTKEQLQPSEESEFSDHPDTAPAEDVSSDDPPVPFRKKIFKETVKDDTDEKGTKVYTETTKDINQKTELQKEQEDSKMIIVRTIVAVLGGLAAVAFIGWAIWKYAASDKKGE